MPPSIRDTIYVAAPNNLTAFTPVQFVTALVAVYGALLATLTFIAQRRALNPRVRVVLNIGFSPLIAGGVKTMFSLEASNRGQRTVFVKQPHILLNNETQLIFPFPLPSSVQFPCELKSGQGATAAVPMAEVIRSLREKKYKGVVSVRAAFGDQAGPDYLSRPFKLDIDRWEKEIASE